MTIARPAGSGGGVTAAEVNLKFVWDVVSRIKIGDAGLAYVVDSTGTLIAHPDISLVLKKTDLSALPQVAALTRPARPGAAPVGARPEGRRGVRRACARSRRWAGPCSSSRRAPRPCAALCVARAHRRCCSSPALADLDRGELLPRTRAGAAAAGAAGRRGADRRRRARPPHRGPHRRRARGPRRAVQPDGRRSCATRMPAWSARSSSAPPS